MILKDKKNIAYQVKTCGQIKAAIKDVSTSGRIVTGFYNTYNFLDSDNDILLPGAAKKSIKERGPESDATAKVKHALNHNLTTLPGKILTLKETEIDGVSGIYFETRMSDTTLGNDTLKNYLEGIYDNHSIGFQYKQIEMIERGATSWGKVTENLINPDALEGKDYIFAIKEIVLFEGSTVAFGANSLTPFLGVKSGNKDSFALAMHSRIDQLGKTLKSGTQSDEMMNTLELQMLQLKQMVTELTDNFIGHKEKIITEKVAPSINLLNIAKNFTL
jgi:HK97 family phage prohead protease